MTNQKQWWEEELDEIFPIFQARNYTNDTIVGAFDENGNLLPSVESSRLEKSIQFKNLIAKVAQKEYERGVNECVKEFSNAGCFKTNRIAVMAFNRVLRSLTSKLPKDQ